MRVEHWIQASRPKTLLAGVAPLILGHALAFTKGHFRWDLLVLLTISGMLLQVGTNFTNDYADFERGADTKERKGPQRAVASGLITKNAMKWATLLVFLLSGFFAALMAMERGIIVSYLNSVCILVAWVYTAGPLPLAYLGFGDLFVLAFFGPFTLMSVEFVQTGAFSKEAAILGVGLGLFSSAILVVNNIRDIREDSLAGKKTVVVRFGLRFGQILYIAEIMGACSIPLFFVDKHPLLIMTLVILGPALPLIRQVMQFSDPRELNATLGDTAKLLLAYTLIVSIGWIM